MGVQSLESAKKEECLIQQKIRHLLATEMAFVRDFNILFEIDFPILFTFEAEGGVYAGYTLDFSHRRNEMEIVVVPTTFESIYELISQKKSLVSFLAEKDSYKRMLLLFRTEEIQSETINRMDFADELPGETFMLSEDIPNKVDLAREQVRLERKMKEQSNWQSSTSI